MRGVTEALLCRKQETQVSLLIALLPLLQPQIIVSGHSYLKKKQPLADAGHENKQKYRKNE